MSKRKVCVVITARPSYSRIKTALHAIQKHAQLELQLITAASAILDRFGGAEQYIKEDGFQIAAQVYMLIEGENLVTSAKTTGLGIVELSTVFNNLKPDMVVTIADRYETMATAVTAAFMNIPLAHVQGGEVTGSIDEKVRHTITKLADLHLVSTEKARERVIRLGEDPEKIHVTGCPSIDLALEATKNPKLDFDPFEKYGGVGNKFPLHEGYLIIMQHPVTTEHTLARAHVMETLQAVADIGLPTLWFWPNVDAGSDGTSGGIRAYRENNRPKTLRMHFFKNMEPEHFLKLLLNCKCIIGNSSAAIRECSFLGVPAVNIGSRQMCRDRGKNVIDAGYHKEQIKAAILKQVTHPFYSRNTLYGDGTAGEKIAECLATSPLTIEKRLPY